MHSIASNPIFTTCPICLDSAWVDLTVSTQWVDLHGRVGHLFHQTCIAEAIRTNGDRCPVCRQELTENEKWIAKFSFKDHLYTRMRTGGRPPVEELKAMFFSATHRGHLLVVKHLWHSFSRLYPIRVDKTELLLHSLIFASENKHTEVFEYLFSKTKRPQGEAILKPEIVLLHALRGNPKMVEIVLKSTPISSTIAHGMIDLLDRNQGRMPPEEKEEIRQLLEQSQHLPVDCCRLTALMIGVVFFTLPIYYAANRIHHEI
jgi:hypothetical protein